MRNLSRLVRVFCLVALAPVCSLHADIPSSYPFGFYRPEGLKECQYPVYAAVQDSSRFIWIGTESGLLKYDGYGILPYRFSPDDSRSLCNNHVSSLVYCHDYGSLIAGTDTGVSIYDFSSDSFSRLEACGYRQVKTLLRDGDVLWVGTAEGLLCFDISDGIRPDMKPDSTVPVPPVYIACARKTGDGVFFGTYDGFYSYSRETGFVMHSLGTVRKLVLDIAPVSDGRSSLWLGTEQGLVMYVPGQGAAATYLENIPIKNFMYMDDGRLWIGTDSGLFIRDADGIFRFRHEARNSSSLPDNVVWYIFRDREDDIFICTDNGIVLPRLSPDRTFVPLSSITGSMDGLNVGTMSYDSCGSLWLGGMNGLIMQSGGKGGRWYRSDTGAAGMRLSHNKIRDIYDDGEGLLAVSDGGLDMIDCRTGRVRHFDITGISGEYLSTWMYSVAEDAEGRLWLGTYDGLLRIDDKDRLLSQTDGPYVADGQYNLSTSPALSGNATMDIAFSESFGAAISNGTVDFIDITSGTISYVDLPPDLYATALAADADCIWIGTSDGLFRLSPDGKASMTGGFSLPVESLAVSGDDIFVISGSNVYIYNVPGCSWTSASFGDSPLFCVIAGKDGTVLLGTADGYFVFDKEKMQKRPRCRNVSVTALYLDNVRVRPGQEYDGNIIIDRNHDLTDGIELKNSQNSFALEYSAFDFSGGDRRFVYRLAGLDESWQLTSENRAVFINVPGGRYVFEVALATADGRQASRAVSLPVRVRPVWYASPLAYMAYLLLAAGICAAVIYYVRMRHQLQIEHLERDRALKMADMKTEFLANVSHEFKSPLSIILGFVGRMLSSESDAIRSRELNTIQQNAEKIHLLLDQMVQFNENDGTSLFIPAAVSIKELAGSVYDRYADAFAQKGINSRFIADDIGYVFMVDRLKMESVLQNLLSNALKFTPSGGSVLMSVSVGRETKDMVYADIRVEDTGCGIAPDELPLIFNRYYRASAQKDSVAGSGIGLALVKEIVEMHKGKVWAESEPGRGSVFTVRLSTMKADSFILQSAGREEYSLHNLSNVWQHDRKPIILLVEDNADIRDLIAASLGKDYVFLLADEGQAGLDLLSKEKIDLVITDIAMPGMDGLTMSRMIRSSLETTFLPIIILTGKNDEQTEIKSFEYADAFISKPFSLNYLNNRIIQLLIKHEQYLARIRQQKMLEPEAVENEKSYDERFLQDVVEIVSRHLEDPSFTAAALCEESRYGSKQVYRKIKQLTGMSIVEFIRDTRLRKASLYLAQGKLSVTEVMYKVGFTTASYFSKCFKEKFGVSPSEYSAGGYDSVSG